MSAPRAYSYRPGIGVGRKSSGLLPGMRRASSLRGSGWVASRLPGDGTALCDDAGMAAHAAARLSAAATTADR